VKFPTGGKVHDRFYGADPVRFRDRRYSPDGRNNGYVCRFGPFAHADGSFGFDEMIMSHAVIYKDETDLYIFFLFQEV